jgi:hypothetical protein
MKEIATGRDVRLFDPIPRIDRRYPRRIEPAYDYLNESAQAEAA